MTTDTATGKAGKPVNIPPALLADLRDLVEACGPNTLGAAVAVIKVLIEEGINRGPDIVSAGAPLGFKEGHLGATLRTRTGIDPARHDWSRDADGVYTLLD